MNIIISFTTVFLFFELIRKRSKIKPVSRILVYIGVLSPMGDYLLRLLWGEIWFQSGQLIFHNFFIQTVFWLIAALLYWVYIRSFRKARRLIYPLFGLLVFVGFSFISTDNVSFFSPLFQKQMHLGVIQTGYYIPLILAVALLATKKWTHLSSKKISQISLGFLFLFILYAGGTRLFIQYGSGKLYQQDKRVSVSPANLLQTIWNVVSYHNNQYTNRRFHIFNYRQEDIIKQTASNDIDLSQTVLLDPIIRGIYLNAFKYPVITTDLQNEVIKIEISEMDSTNEFLAVKKIQIMKNKSGQIIDSHVEYGSLF